MRRESALEWEILEAEAEEWAEVTMAPAPAVRKSARRQGAMTLLGVVVLLVAVAGASGYRLWREAEAGIVATERHIGTLVEVETLRQQAGEPGTALETGVQSVVVKGSAAMVRVVVTDTSYIGANSVSVETRFYCRDSAGWTRVGPIAAFWGRRVALDTPAIHFDYYESDRQYVEAIAVTADHFYRDVRQFLGLSPLSAGTQITVAVRPMYGDGYTMPDGSIVVPSPLLSSCEPGCKRETALLAELRTQFALQAVREGQAHYHVPPQWVSMLLHLARWAGEHPDRLTVVTNVDESTPHEPLPSAFTYLARNPIVDEGASYHYPGYAAYRRFAAEIAMHNFYDSLIADRGLGAVPVLLAALGTEDCWPDVVQAAFGLSTEEIAERWREQLRALQHSPSALRADEGLAPIR